MFTNVILSMPATQYVEIVLRDMLCELFGYKGGLDALTVNKWIPRRMYGLARIAVDYFTGEELKVNGQNMRTGDVLVHADGRKN
jgi:hypothetical protein